MLRRILTILCLAVLGSGTASADDGRFQYVCSTERFDWPQILQRRHELPYASRLHLGYREDLECWSLFVINKTSSKPERVFLEHLQAFTSRLESYHIVDGQLVKHQALGLNVPFKQWSVDYRLPIFDMDLLPGENLILVRQSSKDALLLGWRLHDPQKFYSRIIPELLFFGGFFAICFTLSFYNLIIFMVNREMSYIYYFFYLNFYGLAQLYIAGFLKQLILQDLGASLGVIGVLFVNSALFFATCFMFDFLDFKLYKRWFRRLTQGFLLLLLGNMSLDVLGQLILATRLSYVLSVFASIYAIACAVIALRQRHPLAVYFVVAWSLLIVGNVFQVLHMQGVIPDDPWIVSLNFIGASFEAVILSYALAHKMRLGRMQEARARRHAFSQLEKMVYPHQIARMKQGEILETTMPFASAEATIICLDIISSTSSQIPDLPNFLRHFFDRCEAVMNRDYNGEQLSASAFRIKELGDGFLCSVGFPFQIPPGQSSSEVAIRLAFDFLSAFDEEFSKIDSAERTFCSVGIAQGMIQGSFTVSGIRSYELFGDSIVLATRYESLRKQWLPDREGHVITLQSRFFESLPPSHQKLFTCHKLTPGAAIIRNDAGAEAFYRGIFTSEELAGQIQPISPVKQTA